MFTPFKFQTEMEESAYDILFNLNQTSALINASTGAGKTVIGCMLIKRLVNSGKKILVIVKQQVLLSQFHAELKEFGIEASVLHSDLKRGMDGKLFKLDWKNPVQITMPTTFLNTVKGENDLYLDPTWIPDLLIIDEAHKGTSREFQQIRDKFDVKVLGLTASPYREQNEEGEYLTDWYGDRLINGPSIRELVAMGRLVMPYYKRADKFDDEEHVVQEWLTYAKGKQTILFTANTEESLIFCKAFNDAGIPAMYITAGSEVCPGQPSAQTPNQRQKICSDFENGVYKVLISCGALCEGFNCPPAEVCMLYRNITTHSLFHQIVGRVLRAHISKTSALIIDFKQNIDKFGEVQDFEWDLNHQPPSISHARQSDKIDRQEFKEKTAIYYTCHSCHHVYNIKKRTSCVYCSTNAQYTIVTTKFKEIQKIAPWVKDAKELGIFKQEFNEIFDIKDLTRKYIAMKRFNDKLKIKIFNMQTGEFLPGFEWVPQLVNKRIDANLPYEVTIE